MLKITKKLSNESHAQTIFTVSLMLLVTKSISAIIESLIAYRPLRSAKHRNLTKNKIFQSF